MEELRLYFSTLSLDGRANGSSLLPSPDKRERRLRHEEVTGWLLLRVICLRLLSSDS